MGCAVLAEVLHAAPVQPPIRATDQCPMVLVAQAEQRCTAMQENGFAADHIAVADQRLSSSPHRCERKTIGVASGLQPGGVGGSQPLVLGELIVEIAEVAKQWAGTGRELHPQPVAPVGFPDATAAMPAEAREQIVRVRFQFAHERQNRCAITRGHGGRELAKCEHVHVPLCRRRVLVEPAFSEQCASALKVDHGCLAVVAITLAATDEGTTR